MSNLYSRQSHDGYQLVHKLNNDKERIFVFYGYNEGSKTYSQNKDGEPQVVELARTDMQLKKVITFATPMTWENHGVNELSFPLDEPLSIPKIHGREDNRNVSL